MIDKISFEMKNLIITVVFIAIAFFACNNNNSCKQIDLKGHIQHTVMFNLKHESNSLDEKRFLEDGNKILSVIPSVKNFEIKKQISPKNGFKFYFTMYFENEEAYEAYNQHPDHVKFVKERWETEVADFLEADFVSYP